MYAAFIEVLKELWEFVLPARSAAVSTAPLVAARNASDKIESLKSSPSSKAGYSLESRVCYINHSEVQCLQVAQKKFDTLRGVLSYGTAVEVVQHKDHWSFVQTPQLHGWVESKYLTDDKNAVFPVFYKGTIYEADNRETLKLRDYLADELLGGLLKKKLQPSEFIVYQLHRHSIGVLWPLDRPRLPGMWQIILKGKRGVSIGVEPKTGSVLEYTEDGGSFLAFVESVTPDDTIRISSVGRHTDGMYEQTECTRVQWREWRPVFISFT